MERKTSATIPAPRWQRKLKHVAREHIAGILISRSRCCWALNWFFSPID